MAYTKGKKKITRSVTKAIVKIRATFNNTIVNITDSNGNTLASSSAGAFFKGSRKSTPYAAQLVVAKVSEVAKSFGVVSVDVELFGPGVGRESGVRALKVAGFSVLSIIDKTSIPHNGCKPPKRRRV